MYTTSTIDWKTRIPLKPGASSFNLHLFKQKSQYFIDEMELKQMLEKLGTPKTHKEVKKMIHEVDTTDSGTISYKEFLNMMLGKKSTVLKL